MTCLTVDPLAPSAHVVAAVFAVPAETDETDETAEAPDVKEAASGTRPEGAARMPSARVPPPASASTPADRRAREDAGDLRPEADPLVGLVAPTATSSGIGIRLSPDAGERPGEGIEYGCEERWPENGTAEMMIEPDEYPQVERHAGDHVTQRQPPDPQRAPGPENQWLTRETDVYVRCIT
jgi:hypothetical protein